MQITQDAVRAAIGGDSEARAACAAHFAVDLSGLGAAIPSTFGLAHEEAMNALLDAFLRQVQRSGGASEPREVADALRGTAADIVLAAAFRQGTPAAIDTFRQRFTGMIRFVTRQCLPPSDAAEAEDESWASLWEKLGQYEGRSNLGTWLYVVVRRWCWNRSRQKPPPGPEWSSDEGTGVEERVAAPDPEVSTTVACDQFSAALDRSTVTALRALTPQERALLRLRYVHEMQLEALRHRPEIYTEGEPIQPVYGITRRVQRAGKKLREAVMAVMTGEGYDAGECARLLQECECVEAGMARKILEELSRGEVQIDAAPVSHASEDHPVRGET